MKLKAILESVNLAKLKSFEGKELTHPESGRKIVVTSIIHRPNDYGEPGEMETWVTGYYTDEVKAATGGINNYKSSSIGRIYAFPADTFPVLDGLY